ncbi:hypothetical protein GAPWKB30_1058 [Gilliamella apicola]|nr:hypothetical protein GAPWKB30_1058 [Gilliamella apicola]
MGDVQNKKTTVFILKYSYISFFLGYWYSTAIICIVNYSIQQ